MVTVNQHKAPVTTFESCPFTHKYQQSSRSGNGSIVARHPNVSGAKRRARPTWLEIFGSWVLQIRQDFRKAANIQGTGRLQHLRGLANPLDRPRDSVFLALETVPISLFNVIRRVGKHQFNTRIVQRSQPINGVPLKQLSVRMFVGVGSLWKPFQRLILCPWWVMILPIFQTTN